MVLEAYSAGGCPGHQGTSTNTALRLSGLVRSYRRHGNQHHHRKHVIEAMVNRGQVTEAVLDTLAALPQAADDCQHIATAHRSTDDMNTLGKVEATWRKLRVAESTRRPDPAGTGNRQPNLR